MTDDVATPLEDVADPDRYLGADRYIHVAEDFLDVELTAVQRRILRAVGEHQRVHVQSGNGVGKSYTAAILNLAFLLRHPGSTNLATSGTYSVLSDVLWKPMRSLFERTDLPGRCLQNPPRIEVADDWYFKAISPRHPGNLEGRHSSQMLVTIEECDKPDISREHLDSAGSSITSDADRMLVISNPPEDENNVAAELASDERWHTVEFSSFESRNVKVDAGETNAERIGGLVDLDTIRDDWRNWNGEEWPGLETARTAHLNRDDLDTRWYRRRAGVIPPAGAAQHRPIDLGDVEAAWGRSEHSPSVAVSDAPSAVGIDVARSGDRTVMIGVHGDALQVHYAERGTDHATQETELRRVLDQWEDEDVSIVVDAVGEGSGLGDRLQQAYPRVTRFKAGATADQADEFKDNWSEALYALGARFADGAVVDDQRLREELMVAARAVTYDERHLASRGRDGATVLEASSKREVTDTLGRSPDYLDAALMACWAAAGHARTVKKMARRGTPDELAKQRASGSTTGEATDGAAETEATTRGGRRRVVRRRSVGGPSTAGSVDTRSTLQKKRDKNNDR